MITTFETNFTVFPEHCNYMPPMVFGGKMLSEMDICAAMTVRRMLYETSADQAVTVGVNNVKFFIGAEVGDLIHLGGEIVHVGIKSLTAFVEGTRENANGTLDRICEGEFVMVSKANGRAVPHRLREYILDDLKEIIAPEHLEQWLDEPNEAFAGTTPRNVLSSGKVKPLIEMLHRCRSGEPG